MRPRIPTLLLGGLAAGAAFSTGAQAAPAALVVTGESNLATDPGNLPTAVNLVRRTVGGSVRLIGTFVFGNCSLCVIVPGPVAIRGVGNPSLPNPDPSKITTILNAGSASMAIVDTGPPTGKVTIENVWFKGAKTLAVMALQVRGTLTMRNNRISDVQPGNEFRFGIVGAEAQRMPSDIAPAADLIATAYGSADGPRLTGEVLLDGNTIDNNLPMTRGDNNNAVAFAGCHFRSITVSGNTFHAGEAKEIEGVSGPQCGVPGDLQHHRAELDAVESRATDGITRIYAPWRASGGHQAA